MSVLVTVGTTSFDELIAEVDKPELIELLRLQGYSEIICQIGTGKYIPSLPNFKSVPNLDYFIDSADLIISHAGAGTILDVLRKHKKLIVVVNPRLMNNHQSEIAEVLYKGRNLLMCRSPSDLRQSVQSLLTFSPLPLPPPNTKSFLSSLTSLLSP